MKRRDFLRAGALSGAAALVPELARAERVEAERKETPRIEEFALDEVTIADLQRDMISGKRTAQSITRDYLERIEALNTRGPSLRAVIETNPDAMSIAKGLDDERKSGFTAFRFSSRTTSIPRIE
jgi:amidase